MLGYFCMFKGILASIIASILALFAATVIVPHVSIDGAGIEFWKNVFWAGLCLGILNSFLAPVLRIITLPLRLITLGLIGIVINMLLVWLVDVAFPTVHIIGLWPLFLTSIVVVVANWLLHAIFRAGR
ncbi:MAG: phage holin family protein [Patescibacteria group bacterium]|nr:phage holin family protein [Patescibacteria group bacterium]